MSEENSFYMTEEGKEKLEEELHHLKMVKRKEVVERTKIAQVEKMIRYAVIIENDTKSDGIVDIGKSVTFKELPDGEEETYTIVGSAEADPFEGKISNDSPIAKSLIGKEEDSEVTVAT